MRLDRLQFGLHTVEVVGNQSEEGRETLIIGLRPKRLINAAANRCVVNPGSHTAHAVDHAAQGHAMEARRGPDCLARM